MGAIASHPSGRSEWVLDERGRSLRATWHPEADLVVVSLWSGTTCIGTVRLAGPDAARLIGLMAPAVERWADGEASIARG
jgi:hypothetical protein